MTTRIHLSRRDALRMSAGLVLLGCRNAGEAPDAMPNQAAPTAVPPPAPPPTQTGPGPAKTLECRETHDQIEGPYYRPGAPERWDLLDPGMTGTIVELDGRVTGLDCGSGLRDVELDVWQATAEGRYDNDGSFGKPPPKKMILRGKLRTEADGRYHVRTVVPGHYLNGSQYRPSHIHVKLRASGFVELTTQLYFPGDPYNDIDPFLHRSLIMAVDKGDRGLKARFDFALRPIA
jgi:protocatechuate 3,4-dioxygenase beta subunit